MRRMLVLGMLAALVAVGLAEPASAVVPARTVKSADGLFKIFIPRGALRRNVRVTIVAKPKSSLPAKLRPETFGKIYEVKPHGLRFTKPVIVTRMIKQVGGFDVSEGIPAVLLVSRSPRGKWDLLRNRSTTLVGDKLVAKATTRHFSVIVAANGGVTATLTPEMVRKKKGESWTANVVLTGPWQAAAGVGEGWNADGVVQLDGQPTSNLDTRSAVFKCAEVGTGTFSFAISVRIAREKPNIAAFFLLVPEWIEAGADLGTVFVSGDAICDPPPPPAPACAEPPRAAPTTHNGESKIQFTALCPGMLPELDHATASGPAGSTVTEYNAHSTSCAFEGTVAVTCKVKPDGRICMILKFTPPLAAGTIVRIRLGKADGTVLLDQNLTVGANGEASCSTGP